MKFFIFIILSILISSLSAWAEATPEAFDSADETARYDSVSVPVGEIQDAKSFRSADKNAKKLGKLHKDYLDSIPAIGLSLNEIKNLKTQIGQMLELEANGVIVRASVYKTDGDVAPPPGTVNLSVAAAKELGVKEGDKITVSHPTDEASLPLISRKTSSLEMELEALPN